LPDHSCTGMYELGELNVTGVITREQSFRKELLAVLK
jgi:hypothetical protein